MKKILGILIFVLGAGMVLSAQSPGVSVISVTAQHPVQRILYADDAHVDRVTNGVGLSLSYMYCQKEESAAIGLELEYELFPYQGFHTYSDIRLSAGLRFPLFLFNNGDGKLSFNIFGTTNIGVSFDFRDDQDKGAYVLYKLGTAFVVGMDFVSVELDVGGAVTFQNGSIVVQLMPAVGVSVPVGGKNR